MPQISGAGFVGHRPQVNPEDAQFRRHHSRTDQLDGLSYDALFSVVAVFMVLGQAFWHQVVLVFHLILVKAISELQEWQLHALGSRWARGAYPCIL